MKKVDAKYHYIRDFVYSHYSKKEAQELEAKNFMIGQPFECDRIECAEDWNRITHEAKVSGIASDSEVEMVFQRWHSL